MTPPRWALLATAFAAGQVWGCSQAGGDSTSFLVDTDTTYSTFTCPNFTYIGPGERYTVSSSSAAAIASGELAVDLPDVQLTYTDPSGDTWIAHWVTVP